MIFLIDTYLPLGKEHWWWDTTKENDGGVSNDQTVRKFIRSIIENHEEEGGEDKAQTQGLLFILSLL